mgnify:CR=1 FL=1|jgi:hypothetical protein
MALPLVLKKPYIIVVGDTSAAGYISNIPESSFGTVYQVFTDNAVVVAGDLVLFKKAEGTFNDGETVYYLVDQANIFFVEESL